MTREDIRNIVFDFNIDLKKLNKLELLHYINVLENKIIELDKQILKKI